MRPERALEPARSAAPRTRGTLTPRSRARGARDRASEVGADAEHVSVGVADVEFADAPSLVCRGVGDVEAVGDAAFVDGVDVVHPDRHPYAFVGGLVAVGAKSRVVGAFAAAALAVAAEEDLAAAGLDRTEARCVVRGVRFPFESLVPAELLEP